jgi:endonuclease G
MVGSSPIVFNAGAPAGYQFMRFPVRLLFIACLALFNADGALSFATHAYFAGNAAPVVLNSELARKTREIGFEAYAVLHSGLSRTPVWSAEHLTASQVDAARTIKRKNAFHAEAALPADERAELSDYIHSGFDRGHMSPSGDMPTPSAQQESFSLANMIPQNPNNNQNLWQGIEEATRNAAVSQGELYVVTGPLFEGASLERINGRVLVPTAIFKAIYAPESGEAGAYVAPNAPGMIYQTMSIAELERRSGINLFPALPKKIKAVKMRLPQPMPHGGRGRNRPVEVESLPR